MVALLTVFWACTQIKHLIQSSCKLYYIYYLPCPHQKKTGSINVPLSTCKLNNLYFFIPIYSYICKSMCKSQYQTILHYITKCCNALYHVQKQETWHYATLNYILMKYQTIISIFSIILNMIKTKTLHTFIQGHFKLPICCLKKSSVLISSSWNGPFHFLLQPRIQNAPHESFMTSLFCSEHLCSAW